MKQADIDAIKARLAAATPGPWAHDGYTSVATVALRRPVYDYRGKPPYKLTHYEPEAIAHLNDGEYIENPNGHLDAVFIAAAPTDLAALLAHTEQLQACVASLQQELAEQRSKVTSLLEDFANGCAPVSMEPGIAITPYWRGVNNERANGLAWAKLKCEELGIDWPIKPIPYVGNLPAPTPGETREKGGSGE